MHVTLGIEEYKFYRLLPAFGQSKWKVLCGIRFNTEELKTIREKGLATTVVCEQSYIHRAEKLPITLKWVLKHGIESHYHNVIEAQEFESLLRKQILPALKDLIQQSAGGMKSAETFEL